MATGFGTIETAIQSLKYGAFDFINKPFTIDEIQHTVIKAVDSSNAKKTIILLNENLKKQIRNWKKRKESLEEKVEKNKRINIIKRQIQKNY